MTADEFNEKYKAYIEKGFEDQGLEIDRPEVTKMLDKEFEQLIIIPTFSYSQIKLKFGSARVYTSLVGITNSILEDKINALIN